MLKISSAGTSNAGKKNINEDNFYMNGLYIDTNSAANGRIYSDISHREIHFYAVFDGIGEDIKSAANPNIEFYEGQTASYAAADMLARLQRHLKTKTEYNIHHYINSFVKKTNKNICDYMRQRGQGLRTGVSFALLCIHGNYAYAYNIGNSKIFLFRDNRLNLVSKNDTQAESLVLAKQISADIARHTPDNKILTQYLGVFENERPPELHTSRISIRAGDKFLICTDGLCDLAEERIFQILSMDMSEQEIVTDLMNDAMRNGGGENMTAVVVGANYSDETVSKADLLKPISSDSPTHFEPLIFRDKFQLKPKHIKYALYAIGALILFIVAISIFFNGPGRSLDPTNNNNNNGDEWGAFGDEPQTGNQVPTTESNNWGITTIDPSYVPTDDDTEEPTEEEPTEEEITTNNNPAPTTNPTVQQPVTAPPPTTVAPATNPPTDPPATDPLAEATTAPPATAAPVTDPPVTVTPTEPPPATEAPTTAEPSTEAPAEPTTQGDPTAIGPPPTDPTTEAPTTAAPEIPSEEPPPADTAGEE